MVGNGPRKIIVGQHFKTVNYVFAAYGQVVGTTAFQFHGIPGMHCIACPYVGAVYHTQTAGITSGKVIHQIIGLLGGHGQGFTQIQGIPIFTVALAGKSNGIGSQSRAVNRRANFNLGGSFALG